MPSAAGIGLVALDVVVDDATGETLGEWAGGSCGNVMAILAYLGWEARPLARLDDGPPGVRIREDLAACGVDLRWIALVPAAPAAVLVERLRDAGGEVRHRFETRCPQCGSRLPGYRAVTRAAVEALGAEIATHDVLYADRPSAGAVAAARAARRAGRLVVFEPSARGDARQMSRLASLADIVKYSHDRLSRSDRRAISAAAPAAEIETLAADGLRYRLGGGTWRHLPAPAVAVRDTAGAGDWTTAGLLDELGDAATARAALEDEARLRHALHAAQALGAVSCRFVGPRSGMERLSAAAMRQAATALLDGARTPARETRGWSHATQRFVCAGCA